MKLLRPVAGWNPQIVQQPCVVKHRELPARDPLDCRNARAATTIEQRFGVLATKRDDHLITYYVLRKKQRRLEKKTGRALLRDLRMPLPARGYSNRSITLPKPSVISLST
jgi:hypothetical protein